MEKNNKKYIYSETLTLDNSLITTFIKEFNEKPSFFISVPGRSEILGNHTDHNLGLAIASAIDKEVKGVIGKRNDLRVIIISPNYKTIALNLNNLEAKEEEEGTTEGLIRGLYYYFSKENKDICGFNAVLSSNIPIGSGLSSSAAIELFIGTALSLMTNKNIDQLYLVKISALAEKNYFKKNSGLLDQATVAFGSTLLFNFSKENPIEEKLPFLLKENGYSLIITNTSSDHSKLSNEYSEIPNEMKSVASYFDKKSLSEVNEEDFYKNIKEIRKEIKNDRAILRALHFFEENKRVAEGVKALKNNDFETFLSLVNASGDSSFEFLQNVFLVNNLKEEPLALAIALTKSFLKRKGAVRVHGGGFLGTIQAYVPAPLSSLYIQEMKNIFGENEVFEVTPREEGIYFIKL